MTTQAVRRRTRAAIAAAAMTLTITAGIPATTADAAPIAPSGLGFYYPPADLVAGTHGSVIWTRPISGDPGIPGARNSLMLYRSVNLRGQPVAVSGTLAIPQGTAPAGGWPLISYAHGTAGVADICAPSRDIGPSFLDHDYISLQRAMLARFVAAGYAVAATDYQGLGTGQGSGGIARHGYLIGDAEQRAVADMALAARAADPAIGSRWVAMGHSQGGQAAMFADAHSQQWAPQSHLLGAVAMAPASHIGAGIHGSALAANAGLAALTGSIGTGAVSFMPLFIRGAQTVAAIDPARYLTPRASAMLPQADDRCIDQLRESNSWGDLPLSQVLRPNADVSALTRILDANEPSNLPLPTPLLVLQGRADTTVAPAATDAMVAQQQLTGQPVEYRNYPGVDHRGLLAASANDALAWANTRFGR